MRAKPILAALVVAIAAAAAALPASAAAPAAAPVSVRPTSTLTSGPIHVIRPDGSTSVLAPGVQPQCSFNGTIWYASWSQRTSDSFGGAFWEEFNKGLRYWNCVYVWQSSRFGYDNQGYHSCVQGRTVLSSIQVTTCAKRGDPSTQLRAVNIFTVTTWISGYPTSNSYESDDCMGPGGGIWLC